MGRVSLTKFQADWLHTVICTCHDIASDSLPHVPRAVPKSVEENEFDAWDVIVEKIANAIEVPTKGGRDAL
jgi:hypothetical protein